MSGNNADQTPEPPTITGRTRNPLVWARRRFSYYVLPLIRDDATSELPQTLARFLARHPAFFLTTVYLYVSAIGLIFETILFQDFGIRLTDFAEPADFLLAAFRHPSGLFGWFLSTTLAVLLVLIAALLLSAVMQGAAVSRTARDKLLRLVGLFAAAGILVILLEVLDTSHAAHVNSSTIKSGNAPRVVVQLTSSGREEEPACLDGNLFLIGTAGEFVFFYDGEVASTHIIPVSNLLRAHQVPEGSTFACPNPTPGQQ